MWRLLFGSANCRIGTLLLIAGTLNGCDWDASSGKSGSKAAEPDTTPAVVESDTTPPAVRAINPSDGSEGVSRTGAITAEFDEDIFAESVDEDSFSLIRSADSNNHAGTVEFDANSNTASFSPNTPLSMLEAYSATLGTEITDLSGNPLAAEYTWSFTAADGAWKTAELIETNNVGGANASQIAVDADGRALAVWEQFEDSRHKIWANRFDGTSWGVAEIIEAGSGGAASAPQIALNAGGQAVAVWTQVGNTRISVWANRFDGSAWGAAEVIDVDDLVNSRSPQVAIDADGRAIAIWAQFDGSWYRIWTRRFDGTDWGAAELIEADNSGGLGDASVPQIVLDASGRALAVWAQFDGSRTNIWGNRFDGSAWGTASRIQTDIASEAAAPQIAINPDGQAFAVWIQSDGTRDNIWANRFDGNAWGTAEQIETDNAGGASGPQIALDADGGAIAVWQQFDGARNNIWANRFDGGAWGAAEQIETDNAGSAVAPQIALDAKGRALAVWHQSDGSRNHIWANRFDGNTWREAELIETDEINRARSPQVAFDADGRAIAVWQQSDGARDNIWANRFE
ncbi:Ig-like domain-containing protein [Marinobacter apostichopi]|uniref:Ig-like domain-containing protein n=1 Tax=Marinobacter apostichopi TaxID=3035454 RepID=UPI002572FEE4|nr:Ig-like domain-containing protein [Marinobacter sp. LA51]